MPSNSNVHVLVVGVGEYDIELPALTEACATAVRLFDFWNSKAEDQTLPSNHSLGSISLLLSANQEAKAKFDQSHQAAHNAKRATRSNVFSAINDWYEIVGPDDLGILHWIGHGLVAGRDGAQLQALWCSDESDTGGILRGLNWSGFENKLRSRDKGRFFCFIDACRSSKEMNVLEQDVITPPVSGKFDISASAPMVLQAAQLGRKSFEIEKDDGIDDFPGGTVFSEAALLSFMHFGGIKRSTLPEYHVEPSSLEDPIERKMRQWLRRRFGSKNVRRTWGNYDSITEMTKSGNRYYPFLKVPQPKVACDIIWNPERYICEIRMDRLGQKTDLSYGLREFDEGFDIDINRENRSSTKYQALQFKNEGTRRRKRKGTLLRSCTISNSSSIYTVDED